MFAFFFRLNTIKYRFFELLRMGIYHIFIVSKSGGLIFNYDHNVPQQENEKVGFTISL